MEFLTWYVLIVGNESAVANCLTIGKRRKGHCYHAMAVITVGHLGFHNILLLTSILLTA